MVASVLDLLKSLFPSNSPNNLRCIYIFETSKLALRLKANCSGSVNSSYLRELIAVRMGYEVIKQIEGVDNQVRYQIKGDVDRSIERRISEYIWSGWWSWYSFSALEEATEFFSYARKQLKPELDSRKEESQLPALPEYQKWMQKLLKCRKITCQEIESLPRTAAIAVFHHEMLPEYFQ